MTTIIISSRQKLLKLTEFSGIYTKYKIGHRKTKSKLNIDDNTIDDNHIKIALLKTALIGIAAQNATIFIIKLKTRPDTTSEKLLTHLDLSGKNFYEAELTLEKLQSIYQGNHLFHLFFAEFERIMADAEISEFPESSKKNYLKIVIAEYIKELTYAQNKPATYEALARLYLQIATYQDQAKKTKQTTEQEHDVYDDNEDGNSVMAKPVVEKDTMDGESINIMYIQTVNIDGHFTGSGLPNDVQYGDKRICGMNDQKCRKHYQKGRCLRCGGDDCHQNICLLMTAYRLRRVRANHQQITETEMENETETEKETVSR